MTSSWVWECPWALEKCELESLSGEKNLSHHQIHPRTFSSQQSCRVDWAMKGAVKVGVTFHFHSLSLLHQMTNLPMCITWKFHKHCPPEIPPSWPFFTTSLFFFFFFLIQFQGLTFIMVRESGQTLGRPYQTRACGSSKWMPSAS